MKIPVLYEDENVLVVDKPANIVVFSEREEMQETLINLVLEKFSILKNVGSPPRYGIVHRLDKETSGVLMIAKNNETLFFLQSQFKNRKVIKKYIALLIGKLKKKKGEINTLIGRSPKQRMKQKIFLPLEPGAKGKRIAITEFKVLSYFYSIDKEKHFYTLVEAVSKTGRKHQLRTHFHYLGYPIAGDKLYSFKNQPTPKDLKRQFLHASFLQVKFKDGKEKKFESELPEDLKKVLRNLKEVEE